MKTILVKDYINNAFSTTQARILGEKIQEVLNIGEEIQLDFSDISRFTTLFFNFSLGKYITELGKEKYDDTFKITNLSALGENTYFHSYENAANSAISQISGDEIKEILSNNEDL
jgi:hypothetical protein